jgi:cell division protein FtsB
MLDNANVELVGLRKRIQDVEAANKRLSRAHQQMEALDKENKAMKQTLKYLQTELVKAGKKCSE